MKKVLFVINTLGGAGAEKALLELLKRFTPDRYEVDLYVLLEQGELISQVPGYVNILNRDYTAESVLSAEGKKKLNKKVFMRLFTHGALFKNIPYLIKNAVAMRGVQYPRICGFFEARQPRRGYLSACHIPLLAVL